MGIKLLKILLHKTLSSSRLIFESSNKRSWSLPFKFQKNEIKKAEQLRSKVGT